MVTPEATLFSCPATEIKPFFCGFSFFLGISLYFSLSAMLFDSPRSAPWMITWAPYFLQFSTLTNIHKTNCYYKHKSILCCQFKPSMENQNRKILNKKGLHFTCWKDVKYVFCSPSWWVQLWAWRQWLEPRTGSRGMPAPVHGFLNANGTMYNVQCTMYNVQCTMYNVVK